MRSGIRSGDGVRSRIRSGGGVRSRHEEWDQEWANVCGGVDVHMYHVCVSVYACMCLLGVHVSVLPTLRIYPYFPGNGLGNTDYGCRLDSYGN